MSGFLGTITVVDRGHIILYIPHNSELDFRDIFSLRCTEGTLICI